MAKRRTPARGVAPLAHGSHGAPRETRLLNMNKEPEDPAPERGRPTVQELDPMAALEAMRAIERAREEMRVMREVRTRQELRALTVEPVLTRTEPSTPPAGPFIPPAAEGVVAVLAERVDAVAVETYTLPWNYGDDPRLIFLREPDSERAAAFRVLRYRLEQAEPDVLSTTVIAVTTPRPRQGATTTALNLALALSECNRARVCLLEGNLRRPALAKLLGYDPPMCLAERMASDRENPQQPFWVAEMPSGLHVLAVRPTTPARSLVDGPAFASAVDALRRSGYRHIVVDGPEVMGIADMNLIEEVVDGVLLVAQGGATSGKDLQIAASQMNTKKLRGVVLLDGE